MTDKTPAEILDALGKPFPKSAVKKRQGGGGKMLDYIETHTVINRLNSATNGEWSFHVKDIQWRADLLMVLGELTIPGLGTRSGFGVQKVSDRGGEDLVKGASSDALKKCATLFGVALELYGADYEAGEIPAQPVRTPVAREVAPGRAETPNATHDTGAPPSDPRKDALGRTLHGMADHDFLHAVSVQWGFQSFAEVPADNRQRLLAYLNGNAQGEPTKLQGFTAFLQKWEADNQKSARKNRQGELSPGISELPNPNRHTA